MGFRKMFTKSDVTHISSLFEILLLFQIWQPEDMHLIALHLDELRCMRYLWGI